MEIEHNEQSMRTALQGRAWVAMFVMSVCWLVCAVIAFSDVEVGMFVGKGLWLWGLGIAVAWTITLVRVAWIWNKKRERLGRLTSIRMAMIVGTPFMGLVGAWLLWTDLDFMFRLKLSERALIAQCEAAIVEQEQAKTAKRWVGLFRVHLVSVDGMGAVRLTTVFPGIFDEAGVYYDPDGVVAETSAWPEERSGVFGPWKRFYMQD